MNKENSSVRIKPLKVIFITNKSEQEMMSLYRKAKREIYNWADDSPENIIDVMCSKLNCQTIKNSIAA